MRVLQVVASGVLVLALVVGVYLWRLPVVIFGDSVLTHMTEKQLGMPLINQSVGLLKTQQIAHIIRNFKQARSLYLTRGVLLEGGVNDLILNGNDEGIVDFYREMLAAIPIGVPVVLVGILQISDKAVKRFEITNAQIDKVNVALAQLCSARRNCRTVKLWDTAPPEFVSDGLHLTEAGLNAVGEAIRSN